MINIIKPIVFLHRYLHRAIGVLMVGYMATPTQLLD